jgi:hypothetical protein
MTRIVDVLLQVGLLLGVVGALGQLTVMILDIFILPDLRWYWGGSLAYFAAPVAFALTARLRDPRPVRDANNA